MPCSALAGLLCAVGTSSASGSSFYNQSESGQPSTAQVYFHCGIFCHNNFSIPVGQSAARPGEGGPFWLTNVGDFTGQSAEACDLGSGHPDVQEQGWAELHYLNSTYEWEMWDSNGQPISGSPFAVQFGVVPLLQVWRDCF